MCSVLGQANENRILGEQVRAAPVSRPKAPAPVEVSSAKSEPVATRIEQRIETPTTQPARQDTALIDALMSLIRTPNKRVIASALQILLVLQEHTNHLGAVPDDNSSSVQDITYMLRKQYEYKNNKSKVHDERVQSYVCISMTN